MSEINYSEDDISEFTLFDFNYIVFTTNDFENRNNIYKCFFKVLNKIFKDEKEFYEIFNVLTSKNGYGMIISNHSNCAKENSYSIEDNVFWYKTDVNIVNVSFMVGDNSYIELSNMHYHK